MSWPPSLSDVKIDLRIDDTDDDDALTACLSAAIEFVEERHGGTYNFVGESGPFSPLPDVPSSVRLGTVRLAGRWYIRRRSPDGLISSADFGASRIPSFDSDIERLLKIGRYAKPVVA
jgi:hypothetical protein